MEWARVLLSRCAAFIFTRKLDVDFEDEVRSHLELATAELVERGMSEEAARFEASRRFGKLTQVTETYRLQRGLPFMETLTQDLRFTARQLWKSAGFTLTAILTLALGMAATLTIFRFVDSALLRPLPYTNPSRLVEVFQVAGQSPRTTASFPNYTDFSRSNVVFDSVAAFDVRRNFVLTDASGAQQVNGIGVTGGFFRTLGVVPEIGRDLDANPANENPSSAKATAIISFASWQKRFNGRTDVLGKAVTLNGEPFTIIGVLPRSFHFAQTGATEFWTTLHPYSKNPCELHRECEVLGVIARLKSGVAVHQAFDNLQSIATQLEKAYPDADRNLGVAIVPLSEVVFGDIKPVLLALLGGATLLLLIAYVNVAGLLLIRSESRRQEFAIRSALGAARSRLIQQFITEGFAIILVSSVLGISLALVIRHLLLELIPLDVLSTMPYLQAGQWNRHSVLFAVGLVLAAWVLFVITPTIRIPVSDLRAGLASGNRTAASNTWRRMGAQLIIFELAATMILLVGAGLLGKSLYKLLNVDIGFVASNLAKLQVFAPSSKYATDEQAVALHEQIVSRLKALPGVVAVGTANGLPVGWTSSSSINLAGERNLDVGHAVGERKVSDDYFSALQARLLRGRYFSQQDNATAPRVVIVNQTTARLYLPGENPVGKQIFFHGDSQHPMQIVGLVADIREGALDEKPMPFIYIPFNQDPFTGFAIAVRTPFEATSIVPTLIATIHKIEPEIATSDAGTMAQTIRDSPSSYLHRCASWLVGGFAALALLLSVVGLYGVVAYSVNQRTREIGIRMALGAQRSSIYKLILNEAAMLVGIGIGVGLCGSLVTALLIRSLLFGTQAWDASTLALVSTLLLLSALVASYIPARRAAAVNPNVILRSE